jgi:hypothetical protein
METSCGASNGRPTRWAPSGPIRIGEFYVLERLVSGSPWLQSAIHIDKVARIFGQFVARAQGTDPSTANCKNFPHPDQPTKIPKPKGRRKCRVPVDTIIGTGKVTETKRVLMVASARETNMVSLGRAVKPAFGLERLPMLVRLRVYNGECPDNVAEYALPQPELRVELSAN